MIKRKNLTTIFGALALSLVAAAPFTTAATAQNAPQVYGSQLMTQQERFEYRQRLSNAETAEQRARIRAEHHQKMQGRAKEMGVTLPDQPPSQGMGKGRGQGSGPGAGQGSGKGRSGG